MALGTNTYEFFNYLGKLPSPPKPLFVNPYLEKGYLYETKVPEDMKIWFDENAGDYCYTYDTKRTLDVSVRKMDKAVCRNYLDHPLWPACVSLLHKKWGPQLAVSQMTPSEIIQDMDLTKAPGWLETHRGFRTKGDCILGGLIDEFMDSTILKEIPLWKVSGKNEIKETAVYVGEMKQRTFIIEPMSMLWQDKKIFGRQNEAIKDFWWSAYGFNPYEGGVSRMADRLSHFKRYWEWDVKGFDRLFPHMKDVQDLRCESIPDDPFKQWVARNKQISTIVLPNGDVVEKSWGNNSGSGTTTGDNIIGMSFPIILAFLELGLNEVEIDSIVECFIFGDDVLGGDNINVSDEVFREVFVKTFSLFGFEFDPFVISHSLEGMTFLGFSLHEIEPRVFVPIYKLPRLCYSFQHALTKGVHIDKELSKMISLMLMSAGHGEFVYNRFRDAIEFALVRTSHPYVAKLFTKGLEYSLPTFKATLDWYAGNLEGLKNFEFLRKEVGIKEILCDVESNESTKANRETSSSCGVFPCSY